MAEGHDTDPLAATQAESGDTPPTGPGKKKRSVRAGDVLGRYELIEDVGEGGMATVYRAKDRELRREVAIKVLFPHLSRRPEVVRRFHREARAAATLEHPNILRIYDVGDGDADSDDPPYIVMELVRGSTLLSEVEVRGPMFAEIVACIGALLADALAAAHHAGIIHRDIKPANVLIAPVGRLLLADFGVARLETEDSLVTKTGALLGTPAYMSPEQASGDTATAKSDLYSLGATLYQLATGTLPYTGSPAKVLAQIAQGTRVPAVKKRAEVGPDLSRVIDRLMAVDPDQRPASAKDIAVELRAIAATGGLGDPADELAAYFADPAAFVASKTPAVVTATVTAAHRAVDEQKLPRAMALAERASALAPDDPTVTALIATVTEGGRASQRRRAVVVGVLGAAVVGGAVATGYAITRHEAAPDAAPVVAMMLDAPGRDAELDAEPVDAETRPDAGLDARPSLRRDAGAMIAVPIDAAVIAMTPDAMPLDAAVVPPDAAPLADGFILVVNDTWCDVTIDRIAIGRATKGPFRVTAGHHDVTCAQTGIGRAWTKSIDVAPGKTVSVTGAMLGDVAVRLEIDATIDGVAYRAGTTASVRAGYHQVEAGGVKKHLDFRSPCTVRNRPDLDCY
jgi:serine/threonine-protein kinase